MSETVRWGILGTGGIAGSFASDLRTAGLDLAAVGSRTADAAGAFAQRFEIANAHGSYEELVANDAVDVVYIASPHSFHAEHALLAIEAGKHVLVEKAFTLNRAEAELVAEAASARGLVAQEAMWTRFLPHMVRLRELIRSGALGEVRAVLADHAQSLPQHPEHRLQNPELGGGALLDLGIYPVSFAWDVLGEPVGATASGTLTATGVDRQEAIVLEYASGARAVLHAALDAAGPVTASVIGTEARADLDWRWYAPTTMRVISADRAEREPIEVFDGSVPGRGMQFEALATEAAIRAGASSAPELLIEETLAIMGLLDGLREQLGVVYPGGR